AQNGSGLVDVEAIVPSDLVLANATPPLAPVNAPEASAATPALETGTATPAPELEASTAPGGFAVQLGAFANYANAQNFLAHAQNQLAAVPVEAKVRQMGGLFRVYVGPYADRDEARRVADRLNAAFG